MDPQSRYESLLTAVEGLYTRLQNDALTSADVVDLSTVQAPNVNTFVSRLFDDQALFDSHFGAFKEPYDIFRVFREDETVLDVGAHWGYSALAMRYQGCRSSIVSVEAMPFNIPALAHQKRLADGRYDFVHVAASDAPHRLTFYVPAVNGKLVGGLGSTGGTLVPRMAPFIAKRAADYPPLEEGGPEQVVLAVVEVGALPLDDIVPALGASRQQIVAIKMDIEGHEAAALKGARTLIAERRPVLMIEGGTQPAVREVMREYGYVRAARVEGQLVEWNQHPPASDTFWYHPGTTEALRQRGLVPSAA